MIEKKEYKAIFFDLDRTIWDFDANSDVCIELIYKEYNMEKYAPRYAKFKKVYEKENSRLWSLFHDGKVTKAQVSELRFERTFHHFGNKEQAAAAVGERYLDLLAEQTLVFDGAHEVLAKLSTHFPLYIITNGFLDVQNKKMKNSGLMPYFKGVVTSEDAGVLKPKPQIFEKALQMANVQSVDALMVGDDYRADIQGAKRMGMDQVWFTSKSGTARTATYFISSLSALLSIVRL